MSKKMSNYKSKYSLTQRIISAITTVGFIMQPVVGFAQSIHKVNDNGSIEVNGNVTQIWADKVVSNAAINEFRDFQLDANKIANMYFNTKGGTGNDAANLVNFVNSRIDINGTVNAVQNSKIGGNLFFLSKDGMVVGKSGVINTGALYVMTPATGLDITSPEYNYTYEGLKGTFDAGAVENVNTSLTRMQALNIPLNASGTISVLGKINATNDVKLAAAKVAVGKNVSGDTVFDTAADGLEKGAAIKTGIVDFKDLVNIDNTSAGLGSDLTAAADGNGDIVLSAKAEYANTVDQTFNQLGNVIGLPDIDVEKTIEASVENYGTITASGDAVLTAEATNGNKDLAEEVLEQTTALDTNIPDYIPVPADDAGNYVQTVARVDVQGDVTARQDITVSANADNTYVDNGSGIEDSVGNILQYITPANANVMILGSKAEVNIGKDAELTADSIDITANSVLDGTAGAAVNGRKLITVSTLSQAGSFLPSAAVGYAKAENEAKVTINGKLNATGENKVADEGEGIGKALNISAYAEESVTNTANLNVSSMTTKPNSSLIAAAVAVTESSNKADVVIGSDSSVTAELGNIDIAADTVNLLNANAASTAPDNTVGSAAVNVFSHEGSANVEINGEIKGQDVSINATNLIDENTITANNELGMGKLQAEIVNAVDPDGITKAVKENQIVKDITASIKNVIGSGSDEAGKVDITQVLSDKFEAGAAVVVADETNNAKVTFGKTADVTADTGDINVDSEVRVVDYSFTASGTSNSYKKSATDGSTTTVTVGTGVVYAGMDNAASVVFADGEGSGDDQSAKLTAVGDINITSNNIMEYNRPQRILREIERSIENIEYAVAAFEKLDEYQKEGNEEFINGLGDILQNLIDYKNTYTSDFTETVKNPDSITAEGTMNKIFDMAAAAAVLYNQVIQLQTDYNTVQSSSQISAASTIISNSLAVVTNALAFADPNNYANVSAQASAKGGSETSKFSASGSVAVSDFSGTSSIEVGKYTKLDAGKNLSLESANAIEDVTITGKNKFWKNDADAKGGVGIGGSFNYQNFDTNSEVIVDEAATLTADDNINIIGNSDIFHVGAMLSAGKSDGSALSGLVTLTDSDSYNNVIVDADAVLKAADTIDIAAYNDTSVTNAIVSFSATGENVGVGMGVAINNIDVQNTAQIIDNDGTEENDALKGEISAAKLNVNAETTGLINSVSVAGGMSDSGTDTEEGLLDKIKAPFKKIETARDNTLNKVSSISNKLQDVIKTMDLNAAAGNGSSGSSVTSEAGTPGFSFVGAGSVSLNMVNDTTKAVIDGATVNLTDDGKLTVGARDSAFTGAWSGAAAISLRKEQQSQRSTSVAVSGAVGVNDIDNEITALVKNSTVTGAKDVDVAAVSGGTTVAAGLGAALTVDKANGKNYDGGGSVSVNLLDKQVNANMDNVTLTGHETDKAAIDVVAYESDVQVTGGIQADIAIGGGNLVGGGVTVADINNNINAGITGGTYSNVNDINVKGLLAVRQVTAAISAGVAVGGSGTNNAFGGAVVYNGLTNNINAEIDGAKITAAGDVTVVAKDTNSSSEDAEPYQELLGDYNEHNKFAEDNGIDMTGNTYYATEDENGLDTGDQIIEYGKSGSTIVGAAAVVAAGSSSNAGGAAVNIADIDNKFTATIANADVTANNVLAGTDADTLLVGVSGGIAAGTKVFGGMGSVTWQDIDNDLTAQINNSTIKTNKVATSSTNDTLAVNVAGSVAFGKNAGVGATLAYNGLDNTVGAYMRGNKITALGNDGGVGVVVDADNTGDVYGIAAGVAASTKAAINGSVAVNRGGSNTEAVIDEYESKNTEINNAGNVNVTADDETSRLAVVGGVNVGKAAVGGAVAYNDVGGSSAGSESSSQNTTAAIKNTAIDMYSSGDINVAANDAATLKTIAVGVAAAANAGVQGSAATTLVNKNVEAVMENTDIDDAGDKNAEVTVHAQNTGSITSSADTASVAGQGAGVGAGVAVNRIIQQTNAAINGGVMNVNNLTVKADADPRIENIGVGIAVAGQGAGVAGSVSVNMIDNDATAHIGQGAEIIADGNVGVVATSDEQISNYSGMLAGAGQGAGVGISVSVNQIEGTTSASVGDEGFDTKVTAKGNGTGLTTDTVIAEGEINNTLINNETTNKDTSIARTNETRNGLIVDASSTRDMKSFLINVGAAGQGAGVAPTVNVNMINGETKADITNTVVNNENAGNVFVNAGDYTNMSGFVGSGGIGGMGAGVGLGSDTNTVSRAVTAIVENSDIEAKTFEVDADSAQGISSFTVGAGVAGIGGGVAGVVTVAELENTTRAALINSSVTADTVAVKANHTGIVNAGNASVGAGIVGAGFGASVGVLKDNSETYTEVSGESKNDDAITANGDVTVAAANTTTVNPMLSATGVGAGGIAGAVSINNINSKVQTNINSVDITSTGGTISGTADNTVNVDAYMGSQAAGLGGVGAVVTVNTIDSNVQTNVIDSDLDAAKDVTLTAKETRNIKQLATNATAGAIAAIGANIAITNIGQKITDQNVIDKIEETNNAYGDDANELLNGTYGALGTAGITNATPTVDASFGGAGNEISVNITASDIKANESVEAKASEIDNVKMTLGGADASLGLAGAAGVGILNINRNVGVLINGGSITADKVDVGSEIKGSADLDVYQGSAGLLNGNAAVSQASASGSVASNLLNTTIEGKDINIAAKDNSATTIDSVAVAAGGLAVGALVAEAENNSDVSVNITSATVKSDSDNTSNTGNIDITSEKNNSVTANATNVVASTIGGTGMDATVTDAGSNIINVTGSTMTAANKIDIAANTESILNANINNDGVGVLASGAVSIVEVNVGEEEENHAMRTAVEIGSTESGSGNTFRAQNINFDAESHIEQTAKLQAVTISGGVAGYSNNATTSAYADTVIVAEENNTYTGTENTDSGSTYNDTNLSFNADNNVTQKVDAGGVGAAGVFAIGSNIGTTNSDLYTKVDIGSTSDSRLAKVDAFADSVSDITNKVNGDGGALINAQLDAAKTVNNINSETGVNIAGEWNVAGDMNVQALHDNNVNLNTDAVKASVIGYSGVRSENIINNNTGINYNAADVTTGGSQNISARNDIDYDAVVIGSGYGGFQGADVYAEDSINMAASVSLKDNSALKAKESVVVDALTGDAGYQSVGKPIADINKEVTIKSAGVIAGTYAESKDDVNYTNIIDVGAGSSIATVGADPDNADITMTAADRTNFTGITTADTQGGVIGAAGTKTTNDFKRDNTINISGIVDSNYDADFDAGNTSKLNLTLKSNAYNKTAAPIDTEPSISGTMAQDSKIAFLGNSSVKSLRNINAAAGAGDTTIAKESKTWRWVDGGETGTGSIASTSDGTLSSNDATITTEVTVYGTLEAGKNHELLITIDSTEQQKENLDNAVNNYRETLENGELKTYKEQIENAEKAYNEYCNESGGLEEKMKALDDKEKEYNNKNGAYKEFKDEKAIIETNLKNAQTDLDTAQTDLDTAQTNLKNAQTDLASWLKESFEEYNKTITDEDKKVATVEDFETGLKNENSDWYNNYHGEYDTKTADITSKTDLVNEATTNVEEKKSLVEQYTTQQKTNQGNLEAYDTTQLKADISKLKSDINTIKESEEYKQLKGNLEVAINSYNDALATGISADSVNEAVFVNKENQYISVTASDWFVNRYGSPTAKIGMDDYAAALLSRFNELSEMMQEYSGTDVGETYSAELTRVQSELQALGVGMMNGDQFIVAEGASTVPTIELKDLMVSGGDVNISSGSLKVHGDITAHGNPSIKITNETDFFLRVNDITIDSAGGNVRHNNAGIVTTDSQFAGKIHADAGASATGSNAQVTISNSTSTKASESNIYTPDIGIYGDILNPYGNISINNDHNSIYVAGQVKDSDDNITQEAGSIKGRTVNLTAGGAVTQGYSDDINDVAGDPKNALEHDYIDAIQKALIAALSDSQKISNGKYYTAFDTVDDLASFLQTLTVGGKKLSAGEALTAANALTGVSENNEPGIAAGGAVYINAASINVNGTIQSGYDTYKLEINENAVINGTSLKDLIDKYEKPAGNVATNYNKYMNDTYLVTDGGSGAVYDTNTKQFVYNIKAWYNPETNEIFTEDIEQAGGGRIYLTGAIANTNTSGGKLVVLDGGSDYNIDGGVAGKDNKFTFKLGSINAEAVDGRIEINDTNTNTQTVYTKDNVTVNSNGDRIASYSPENGQYYNWSNGTANRVTTSYKHVSDSSWFGLSSDNWENTVGSMDQVTKDSMRDGESVEINDMLGTKGNVITDGSVNGYTQLGSADSGTSAITGSSEKDSDTLYQILFERKGKPKQGVNGSNQPLYWTTNEDGNKILTTDVTDEPYYLQNDDDSYIYETEISDKVVTTKKKGLFGLWGKTITTEWKETSGMLTAYNFGLKADNSIGIEFVGNAAGSVGTVTSNSDILLGGDIRMGRIDVASTTGKIYHADDATVISDNASFNAKTGIDVIQKNVDKALVLNAVSESGDINITALAANANNMVNINKVSTSGNVNITAEGNMLNNAGTFGAVVTGNEINLVSYDGSIGTNADALRIDGGTAGTNVNAAGSIYLAEQTGNMYIGEIVAADGDVVLEAKEAGAGFVDAFTDNSVMSESDEARIESWEKLGLLGSDDENKNSRENQQQSLENTAKSGSFFLTEDVALDEAQEQGQALLEKGKEFVDLMKGGSEEVEAARQNLNAKQGELNEAIADLGDDAASKEAYKAALEAYNEAYDVYAEKGAAYEQAKAEFIADSGFADNPQAAEWLTNYEAIGNAAADNYGWTKEQLLYAIQDSVINPTAGSIGDVKTANVKGNNITFKSDTGNIGVVDTQTTVIAVDELTNMFTKGSLTDAEEEQLDKLSMARAGDVTWGDENITIARTTPVSVQLNKDGGKVTVTNTGTGNAIADHIYLLAKDSVLNADELAANDLRLSGHEGINVGSVAGDKIYLEGGSGDIGHKVDDALQAVQVTLNNSGYVNANAVGNVKLQQAVGNTGDFTINSIVGKNVDITANNDIVSKVDDVGYINASDTINLVSTSGGIGTAAEGLRIRNSGSIVNTDVQNAINIEAQQDGTLILGAMKQTAGGVNVNSEGSIYIGREADDNDDEVYGYIDAKDDVSLHAADDIIISGKLHVKATDNDGVSDSGALRLHADEGDIIQTTTEKAENIVVSTLDLAAIAGDIELDNEHNIIRNVNIRAVGGDLALTVSNPDGFNVDMGGFTNKRGGDIKFTNSDGSVNITTIDIVNSEQKDPAYINGNLTVKAIKGDKAEKADIWNQGILNATGTITFDASNQVINDEALNTGKNIEFKAGEDIDNNAQLTSEEDVRYVAGGQISNDAGVNAGKNIEFKAGEDIDNNAQLIADEDVRYVAGGQISNDASVDAGKNIEFKAEEDINNNAQLIADEDVRYVAGGQISNDASVDAGKNIEFKAGEDINNNAQLTADEDVHYVAGGQISNDASVNAGKDVNFDAENNIINNDIVNAGSDVKFISDADIINNSTVNANNEITFTAVDGKITSDTVNGRDVIMEAIEQELQNIIAQDSVTFSGDWIYAQDVKQDENAVGDIIINTSANKGIEKAIQQFVINRLEANNKSIFTELWAENADVTTVNDLMDINQLSIEDTGYFENTGTEAVVYGEVPIRGTEDVFLWYDPQQQRNPWMYLNFIDDVVIDSNGELLRLKEYWYAYDQRFTAENHMRYIHNYYLDEDYEQIYGYGLSLHERYNLVDYQEFDEKNADEDEIIVKA